MIINKKLRNTIPIRSDIMSKNDKKKRTSGVIHSANTKMPNPEKSFNTPTSDYDFTDNEYVITTSRRGR